MMYVSVKTKNVLESKECMFYWQGRSFRGLVDVEDNALYDHPDDSFMEHLGLENAIDTGLILPIEGEQANMKIWDVGVKKLLQRIRRDDQNMLSISQGCPA